MADPESDPPAPDPNSPSWLDTLPPEAKKAIVDLRRESAGYRTRLKALEAGDLTAKDQEIRQLKVQNALERKAHELAIPWDLAHAMLTTDGSLAKVDISAEDYGDRIGELVDDLVGRRPELKKLTPAGPPSGAPIRGPGAGPSTQLTRQDAADLGKRRPEALLDALHRGDLDGVLGRRP